MNDGIRKQMHAFVTGRVQGVAYRTYTQREANRLNISGWVKNLPDGSVEILAQGYEQDLYSFIEFLKRGSPSAIVDSINVNEESLEQIFLSFNIRFI